MFHNFTTSAACHRIVSKQTNPIAVNDLITEKFVAVLKSLRSGVDTQGDQSSVPVNVWLFKNIIP